MSCPGSQAALFGGLDAFASKFERETGGLLGNLPRANLYTNVSFTDSDVALSVVSASPFSLMCHSCAYPACAGMSLSLSV
jgi:hypothetical protein